MLSKALDKINFGQLYSDHKTYPWPCVKMFQKHISLINLFCLRVIDPLTMLIIMRDLIYFYLWFWSYSDYPQKSRRVNKIVSELNNILATQVTIKLKQCGDWSDYQLLNNTRWDEKPQFTFVCCDILPEHTGI